MLTELLGGDDPAEFVFAVLYGETDDDCLTIIRRTPPHSDPDQTAQCLIVDCSFRGPVFDRRRVIASLRHALPANLVESVLIDGRSWDLPEVGRSFLLEQFAEPPQRSSVSESDCRAAGPNR